MTGQPIRVVFFSDVNSPFGVPHFFEIEPDGSGHLMTWDVSFPIRPIHRVHAETELLSEFFD